MQDPKHIFHPDDPKDESHHLQHKQNSLLNQSNYPSTSNWKKSLVVAAFLIVSIGATAFFLGRNRLKPVDWIRINAIDKQDVIMPDGSKIWLRKGSALDYPSDFGKSNRRVNFSGEAYFDVLPFPSLPFIVQSINGKTTNYGKSFFIRSNDSVDQVFVSNGRVLFESNKNQSESLYLNSGQKGEIIHNKIATSQIGKQNFFAWENNRLTFYKTPLTQVIQDIRDFYGVPIHFDPEINLQQFLITAVYDNQTLDQVLMDLSVQSKLLYTKENGYVLIQYPSENAFAIQNKKDTIVYKKPLYAVSGQAKKRKKKSKLKEWANHVFSKSIN